MSDFKEYLQHSANEMVDHAIEASISFASASIFMLGSKGLARFQATSSTAHFLKYIAIVHIKDGIMESITSFSYLPVFNIFGWFSTFSKVPREDDGIGDIERYSQLTEFFNKAIPLFIYDGLIDSKFAAQGSVFTTGRHYNALEEVTAIARVPLYGVYEKLYPDATYKDNGYFTQEVQLHLKTEAIILFPIALLTAAWQFYTAKKIAPCYLLDEFVIELSKGLEFALIDYACPGCSNIKADFSQAVGSLIVDNHMMQTHLTRELSFKDDL